MTIVEKELTDSFVKRLGFRMDATIKIHEWFKKRNMNFGGVVHFFVYESSKFVGLFVSIVNDDLDEFGVDMLKELSSKYSHKNSDKGKELVDDYIKIEQFDRLYYWEDYTFDDVLDEMGLKNDPKTTKIFEDVLARIKKRTQNALKEYFALVEYFNKSNLEKNLPNAFCYIHNVRNPKNLAKEIEVRKIYENGDVLYKFYPMTDDNSRDNIQRLIKYEEYKDYQDFWDSLKKS